jgi:hypothetical protein
MRCLTGARYNMLVDVLHETVRYDPDSGEVRKSWTLAKAGVPCTFHGILEGGIRVAGTTERFGNIYENIDWAKMEFYSGEPISKRSQVTNVRNLRGVIIWREEEMEGAPPTVFDVQGVTPIVDSMGNNSENTALLQRHEVQ